jgi:membrane fusion protein, adhesin transport system
MSEISFKRLSRQMADENGLGSSAVLFTIIALVISLVVWANYAELDNVTRGEGRVISSVQNQVVQAADSGVILARYVSENTFVEAGDLLFEIDPVDAASEFNQMNQRMFALDVREKRLRAEISGDDTFELDTEANSSLSQVEMSEQSLFLARRLELQGKVLLFRQRQAQKTQEIYSGETAYQSSLRTMELIQEEIDFVEPLVKDNIAPATQLLELQRKLEQARAAGDRSLATITQAELAEKEISRQIQNARSDHELKAMEELNKLVADRSELKKALPRLKDRISRTVIKAPMDGIINTLNFRTAGGYVRTGDIVLELVPTGEALIVEAKINPKDISRIHLEDQVMIRFSAYDSSKFGHVMGRVLRISPDAVTDPQTGMATHFLIDVAIEGEMLVDGQRVNFLPGMTASVDVLSGKRTIFEYLWQPIAKVNELALRE